jgi:GNAT superfamily N-acetyltransferase
MAITIRLLKNDEIEFANNFFNRIYQVNRSIKDFQWEFLNGPFGVAIYIIAVDDAFDSEIKIVGIQCAIPIELTNAKGNVVLTAKSEDTLVDPSYRGQKIFEMMYNLLFEECKKAGIKYIWGFTPAKKAFERIGFQIPFAAHQALMVFKPLESFSYLSVLNKQNKLLDKLKIAGLISLSFLFAFRQRLSFPASFTVKQLPIQSKIEIIKNMVPNSPLFFLNMDGNYVLWRLNENPFNNNYKNFQFLAEGKLIADAIINQSQVGYIEQLIFAEGTSLDTQKNVLFQLIRLMKKKIGFIRMLCFDVNTELKSQEALFRQCGFIVLKRGAHFVWRPLFPNDDLNPRSLFLTRLFTQGNQ